MLDMVSLYYNSRLIERFEILTTRSSYFVLVQQGGAVDNRLNYAS